MRAVAIGCVAAAVVLTALAGEEGAMTLKSSKPRYIRLNMSEDGAKHLVAVLDESRGTSKGYDTLYIWPVGFAGATNKVTGKVDIRTDANWFGTRARDIYRDAVGRAVTFPPIRLDSYVQQAGSGDDLPSTIDFMLKYSQQPQGSNIAIVTWNGLVRWEINKQGWTCSASQYAYQAESAEGAKGISLKVSLEMKLELWQAASAMQSGARKSSKKDADAKAIIVGVAIMNKETELYPNSFRNRDKQGAISVVVTDAAGKVVKKDTVTGASLAPFWNGSVRASNYSVKVPKAGIYTVETTMDIGPFGGELKQTAKIEVK